jgi:lipoteichoic acid synthase
LLKYTDKIKRFLASLTFGDIIFVLLFFGFTMVKLFYFQFTTGLNTKPYFDEFNTNMLLGLLGALIVLVSFFILLFSKRIRLALLCLDIFLSLLILADTLYFRYYHNAVTVPVLYHIRLVESVGESAISLFKKNDLIYLLDFPFLIFLMFVLREKAIPVKRYFVFIKRFIAAALMFAAGFMLFQYSYEKSDNSIFIYNNNYVIKDVGILYFHYYDMKRFVKENVLVNRFLDEEDKQVIEDYYKNKPKTGSVYTGAAKGKNLIVVQAEALQGFVINMKYNEQEVTPNLNKFINESVYFDNFYCQVGGGNTADAEFLLNTSLYPMMDGSVYFRFPTNTFHSLPKLLKNEGYDSYVFHANNSSFWNRTEAYRSLGFNTYMSEKDYKMDEIIGWGLSDISFFKQSLDSIDTTKPFYGFFITLSSHHPYYFFRGDGRFNAGKYENTFIGDYLKAMNYVDYAFGRLTDDLKERGLYDNSILVFYGDHTGVQKDEIDNLEDILKINITDLEWAKMQRVPCFIRWPGLHETGVNKTIGGEIDLMPTIANLLGLSTPYAIGNDLFNVEKPYAVLRNSTLITDEYIYLADTGKVYNHKGEEVDKKIYKEEIIKLRKELVVSDLIIEKDAFKVLSIE